MNRLGKRLLSGIFALVMISSLLCTTASASVQSSAYLDGYRAGLTADPHGEMVISVDVSGVGYMPEIGAKTIYVYESSDGTDFHWVATYESSDYPKMMGSGTLFYEDVITHQGTVGLYYYAKVFVYAGNSSGGDERVYNTAIRQARA
ncbi:hypothetical protein [uncultured Oscillibacter sp.]|uniref:hypothetical protein n=1 Tax=uncultured Oscillibacter sp. TaxID=876091 RepID=UPI00260C2B0F|nr:hypothetical protein [uncultured Oscillibacter sp.]